VSNKEGTFFEERGHDSRENFFCEFLAEIFFCCGRPYCTDPYSPVQPYRFGTKIEEISGMDFEADFCFCSLFLGRTEQSVQLTVGTENKVEEAGQRYGFGMENEADFCGTDLVL
jgi:hypothetical protein